MNFFLPVASRGTIKIKAKNKYCNNIKILNSNRFYYKGRRLKKEETLHYLLNSSQLFRSLTRPMLPENKLLKFLKTFLFLLHKTRLDSFFYFIGS